LIIGLAVGYFLANASVKSFYENKLEKIKSYFPQPREDSPFIYDAVVKKVNNNVIVFTIPASLNPFDEWPVEREVIVSERTKIVKREIKPASQYNEESAKFMEKPIGEPPTPYIDTEIKIEQVKEGEKASIEAFENVKTKTRFEAKTITFF
jgi:hypothetical protein